MYRSLKLFILGGNWLASILELLSHVLSRVSVGNLFLEGVNLVFLPEFSSSQPLLNFVNSCTMKQHVFIIVNQHDGLLFDLNLPSQKVR